MTAQIVGPGGTFSTGGLTDGELRAAPVAVITATQAQRVLLDYGVRTDGLPVYVGVAPSGTPTSAPGWQVLRLTWDGSDRLTDKQELSDVWDDRATLGWV